MSNEDLCWQLVQADTADEVIEALEGAGYWDAPSAWRLLGDNPSNFSVIGNQQSEAVASLVEKIVNSVDARLLSACRLQGIDPEAPNAPASVREAVARFFEGVDAFDPDQHGRPSRWDDARTTAEAQWITVAATGNMPETGFPSISVADLGEGQTPDDFPNTFLSLLEGNKLRVPFVQGRFNMGGTGALQFSSPPHGLQLIVSRRNPDLLDVEAAERARQWGFTVVRREPPSAGARNSVFTYLAPINGVPARGSGVLSFNADEWPIFPEVSAKQRDAYARSARHGTLIKLYEYEWQGTKSNIVQSGGGLLRRIDLGLPELALPVRVYECRPSYRGHAGSFATNVLGLVARLDRDRADKLEEGFPLSSVVDLQGNKVRVRVYAFRRDASASDYRTAGHGVVFTVNGQSHATFSLDFYRRKRVAMSYLADSLVTVVDCTDIDGAMREDLFMTSRDRLRTNRLSQYLESALEELLSSDSTLRELRNRRREEDLADKLSESKPLVSILEALLSESPSLAQLLLLGGRVSSPFPRAGSGRGRAETFEGKTYPTYFRFKGRANREVLRRTAEIGRRVRLSFETDAEDQYFVRELDRGEIALAATTRAGDTVVLEGWTLNGPHEGLAHVHLHLPEDAGVGDALRVSITVNDPSRIKPFVNFAELDLVDTSSSTGRDGSRDRSANQGKGSRGTATELALPEIIEVTAEEWEKFDFDDETSLRVRYVGQSDDGDADAAHVYDFYINVDNKYLRASQKDSKVDPRLHKARFTYALVLFGMSMLRRDVQMTDQAGDTDESVGEERESLESLIGRVSDAIAPSVLPILESLGQLAVDDLV